MSSDIQSLPLHDIHLPQPVSWWPPAPGWWLVAALLLIAIGTIYLYRVIRAKQQLSRQVEEEFWELLHSYESYHDAHRLLEALSALLRRVSISLFPARDVAGLTGQQWLQFLDQASSLSRQPEKCFDSELGRILVTVPYTRHSNIDNAQIEKLIALCREWVQQVVKTGRGKTGAAA